MDIEPVAHSTDRLKLLQYSLSALRLVDFVPTYYSESCLERPLP